ncbi:fluoride efflux transporter FluC [Lactococcus termiticola]|uniref:Fluoride-specific ion channel FluC n=1 Tax=Lactococcus termiticola TaxID=2169526 RepID=A0A2R5HIZ2_9LACT|nr:CrcB family protein [Lactococcus termiticola]GBG96408.1 camphor resistance protein CrcB [Lactococcus termiticola]
MHELGLVGAAAGLGALVRYAFSYLNIIFKRLRFPIGTYIINILGSFLIGFIFAKYGSHNASYAIFATGFCGGLTTFSTYNFELFELIEKGDYRHFAEYFVLTYGLGFVAVLIGLYLAGK